MKILNKLSYVLLSFAIIIFIMDATVYYLFETALSETLHLLLQIAICLLAFFLLVQSVPFFRSLRKRSIRESIGITLLIPIIFGALSMIYMIMEDHKTRIDFTISKKFSLSSQTINIVSNLDLEVSILCFYKDGQPGKEFLKTGLEQYQYHSDRIVYEFIDPDRYPARAKEYGIEQYGEVVVTCSRGTEKLSNVENEETITNAILTVISTEKKCIYFVTGHGEADIDNMERNGYGLLHRQLSLENYDVKTISLIRNAVIPSDASCVVFPCPKTDFFDEEMTLIKDYVLRDGGNVLFLCERESPMTYRELLNEFGVTLGRDVVIDKMSQLFGASYDTAVIGQYGEHAITKGFNVASFLPSASSLTFDETLPHDLEGTYIAYSGQGSWAETNMSGLEEEQEVCYDEDDMVGPVAVGAVLTKEVAIDTAEKDEEGSEEQEHESVTARIVVYGDADFVSNTYLRLSGNRDFFLNAIAWLSGEETLISIRPKRVDATPLFLTRGQARTIFIIPVIAMPLFVLLIGSMIFIKRKRS